MPFYNDFPHEDDGPASSRSMTARDDNDGLTQRTMTSSQLSFTAMALIHVMCEGATDYAGARDSLQESDLNSERHV